MSMLVTNFSNFCLWQCLSEAICHHNNSRNINQNNLTIDDALFVFINLIGPKEQLKINQQNPYSYNFLCPSAIVIYYSFQNTHPSYAFHAFQVGEINNSGTPWCTETTIGIQFAPTTYPIFQYSLTSADVAMYSVSLVALETSLYNLLLQVSSPLCSFCKHKYQQSFLNQGHPTKSASKRTHIFQWSWCSTIGHSKI